MDTKIDPDGTREHEANVVVDRRGNIFYFWIARDHLPYLAISRNGGRSFGKPLMIAPPGVIETNLPVIDIGPHGGLEMVYMGSTNAPGAPFPETPSCLPTTSNPTQPAVCAGNDETISTAQVDQHYAGSSWNGYITVTGDPLDPQPLFYSATVNDPSDPLIRGACLGRCGAEYDFLGVFANRDGTPWAAYVDGCETTCTTGGADNADEGILGKLQNGPTL
jgi:hypothetical protein